MYTFTGNNVTIDLGGHTLVGNGTGNAFNMPYGYNNQIIRNGIIRNFTNGLYHSHSANTVANIHTIENITFVNNTNDVYIDSWQNSRVFNFIDCYFEDRLYVTEVDTLYFEGNTVLNHTPSDEFYLHATSLVFNTTNDPMFGFVNFNNVGTVSMGEAFLGVADLCGSIFSSVGGLNKIKLAGNATSVGNCFSMSVNDMTIDLNGYTITGDGTGNCFAFGNDNNNLRVENGYITNFVNGIYQNHNSNTNDCYYYVNNVGFSGNSNAIYFDSWGNSRRLFVTNSTIEDTVYLRDLNVVNFALNNITDGTLFDVSDVTSFSTNVLLGGVDYVGNMWGDFVCSDLSDTYYVDYKGWRYTVCNSSDYSNTVTDSAPLISVERVPVVESWGRRIVMPFGSVLFGVLFLVLFFTF